MRYLTAIIPLLLLFLLDILILASCLAVVGLYVIDHTDFYPLSYTFADKIWGKL